MTGGNNTIGSGTAAGALQYLNFLSSKGHVAPGAIAALKTGFSRVMKTVGGEDWEKTEVRGIDVDSYMTRFANMTHGRYNAASLIDYKSRVKKVATWYLEFLSKPGWTPEVKVRKRSGSKAVVQDFGQEPEKAQLSAASAGDTPASNDTLTRPARTNLIAFPFPLSDGNLATLYLPPSILASDATRMARFVESLVVEVEQEHAKS